MANKSKSFNFRLSQKDFEAIQKKAAGANLSITAYITSAALDKNIVYINGLDEVSKELKRIGTNLNQLTTLCNMGKLKSLGLSEVKEAFSKAQDLLGALLEGK